MQAQQQAEKIDAVRFTDLSGEVCPMTFVKTKLNLEVMAPGEILEVVLAAGESMRSVPMSLKNEGHTVVAVKRIGEVYHLFIRKNG